MKKYINCQQGFDLSIKEACKLIKQVGFDGVFLSLQEGDVTDDDVDYIKKIGLDIETIHTQYNKPRRLVYDLWANNENTQDSINIFKSNIDFAYKHGVKKMVIHSSASSNPPKCSTEGLKNFKTLVQYAKERDIILCFENIKFIDYQEYIVKNLNSDNAKYCFDIGHANGFTKNLTTYNWDEIFKNIGCVHIHDNNGESDQHLIPYYGNIDYKKYLGWLYKYKKDLNITLELYYHDKQKEIYGDIDPLEFYKKAYKSTEKIETDLNH